MIRLFTELRELLGTSSAAYIIIRGRFFRILTFIAIFSLFAVGLNFWGYKGINAIIGCILPFVISYIFSSPTIIGSIILAGIAENLKHSIQGIEKVAQLIGTIMGRIMLATCIFFLIMSTIQFGRNPGAIVIAYLSFGTLLLMNAQKIKKPKIAIGICYAYACFVLIISIAIMIPATTYNKVIGVDPVAYFRTSEVDEQVVAVEETANKVIDKYHGWLLTHVDQKISGKHDNTDVNKVLSMEAETRKDMQIAKEVKEERNSNSFIGLYKQARNSFRNLKGIEEDAENPEIKIIKNSEKSWDVYFYTDKPTRVLTVWSAGRKLNITASSPLKMNSMGYGEKLQMIPVRIDETRLQTEDKPLYLQYTRGGKITINFS